MYVEDDEDFIKQRYRTENPSATAVPDANKPPMAFNRDDALLRLRSAGINENVAQQEVDNILRTGGQEAVDRLNQAIAPNSNLHTRSQTGQSGTPQAQSPTQQWNAQPAASGQSNELYSLLMDRAKQGTAIDRNDPNIRQQADAFSANTERSRRNYLSDVAEQAGPFANLQGERRMASERAGIESGTFESELIGREQDARREEIQQAITILMADGQFDRAQALQRELAMMTDRARTSDRSQQNDQFMRELALREWDIGNQWDYNWSRV